MAGQARCENMAAHVEATFWFVLPSSTDVPNHPWTDAKRDLILVVTGDRLGRDHRRLFSDDRYWPKVWPPTVRRFWKPLAILALGIALRAGRPEWLV